MSRRTPRAFAIEGPEALEKHAGLLLAAYAVLPPTWIMQALPSAVGKLAVRVTAGNVQAAARALRVAASGLEASAEERIEERSLLKFEQPKKQRRQSAENHKRDKLARRQPSSSTSTS